MTDNKETVTFSSPNELARDLFDRAVTADMNQHQRLRAAVVSAAAADHLWEKYNQEEQ